MRKALVLFVIFLTILSFNAFTETNLVTNENTTNNPTYNRYYLDGPLFSAHNFTDEFRPWASNVYYKNGKVKYLDKMYSVSFISRTAYNEKGDLQYYTCLADNSPEFKPFPKNKMKRIDSYWELRGNEGIYVGAILLYKDKTFDVIFPAAQYASRSGKWINISPDLVELTFIGDIPPVKLDQFDWNYSDTSNQMNGKKITTGIKTCTLKKWDGQKYLDYMGDMFFKIK